jgi:hypothetical protein
MVNTQIDQRTSHKVRETRSLENLKLLTICLLTASIVVCYQDVYTATFRTHRFRSLVRTQRLKCETGSQLLGPFRTAVSHFRRFAFRVSLSQFRDALKGGKMAKQLVANFFIDQVYRSCLFLYSCDFIYQIELRNICRFILT